MMEFLVYDLKAGALIAVFYMFYRLMLSRETLHRMNRMVLLTTAVASFVLPLCVVTIHHSVVVPLVETNITAEMPVMAVVESSQPLWQIALTGLFFAGIAVTLGYHLWSVAQVVRLIHRSEQHPQADGTTVCVADKDVSPFSWMHYIVLSRHDYESPDPAIMAHERGHIRQRHSLDVVLVDTLTVLQWFNPAMWMLRQDLRAIHEYEADAAVLSQGINMRQYLYLLVQKAVVSGGYSIANGITHSTLKNRINMMLNNKKSNSKSWLKLLALLPILGTVLALNAETVTDYVYQHPQKKMVKKGRKAGKVKVSGNTIEVKADTTVSAPISVSVRGVAVEMKGDLENPLVIIDGKRSSMEELQTLDPQTIDHIDVLKDKASIDLYGEDGKNGVILITTKNFQLQIHLSTPDGEEFVGTAYQEAYNMVEKMPEFPGGIEAMMKFLSENVKYPEAAHKAGAQGKVLVNFIVEPDGSVSNVHVAQKVNDDLDAEAIRVIGSMPKWSPGMEKGQAVRVKYALPILFRLQ